MNELAFLNNTNTLDTGASKVSLTDLIKTPTYGGCNENYQAVNKDYSEHFRFNQKEI